MGDSDRPREALLVELETLRRRVAELEAAAIHQLRTTAQLAKDVSLSEAALKQREATERALLESASEGILLIDASGTITLVNGAAERMFGFERGELLGEPLEILLPERVRAAHVGHRAGYFAAPRVRTMGIGLDLAGRRKDGSEFPVEISLSYVRSESGMVAMAFVTDITERKRVEGELQQQREAVYRAEKLAALGTLSAGIAHEMNNPLGIITSRIEVMLLESEDRGLPAAVVEDLRVLHRASQRVAKIATSLRSFARRPPEDHRPVDLNAVVEEALLLMEKPLLAENIRLVTTLDRTLPAMRVDAAALQQVLMNLLVNAREAMTDGGEIRIATERAAPERPDWLRLSIADTGPGIAFEALSRVFDPFYTTKRSGTGLGLSVSYGIVQEHEGTMDLQSRPGDGTTFVLTFPPAPASRAPGDEAPSLS
jgi:PAS domain S-box-containing protein